MAPRHAGASKASLAEGARFAHHLLRLRSAVLKKQVKRSAAAGSPGWFLRMILFGLVGLSGLLVNTAVLMLLGTELPRLHYLVAATLATEASTTWLFVLTERLVFRGAKPGTVRSRAIRFFLLNNLALLVRLPLLALAVEWLGVPVVPANVATLVLLFLVRFVVADAAIYGAGASSAPPPREPMRVIVGVAVPRPAVAQTHVNGANVRGALADGVLRPGRRRVRRPGAASGTGPRARQDRRVHPCAAVPAVPLRDPRRGHDRLAGAVARAGVLPGPVPGARHRHPGPRRADGERAAPRARDDDAARRTAEHQLLGAFRAARRQLPRAARRADRRHGRTAARPVPARRLHQHPRGTAALRGRLQGRDAAALGLPRAGRRRHPDLGGDRHRARRARCCAWCGSRARASSPTT